MERRDFVAALGAGGWGLGAGERQPPAERVTTHHAPRTTTPGRLRQSVCRWPFASIPLPDFCRAAAAMGLEAIDLLHHDEWAAARDAGLVCSMGNTSRRRDFLTAGIADAAMHATVWSELEDVIPRARAAGVPNVIVLTGNRRGRPDQAGIDASVACLARIMPLAVSEGVTVYLEMLNSKVNHPDYMADTTAFGVAVAEGVNSPRFKLLYDIYHMQIMEGDVIATIRRHARHLGHFHTAGVPGRHELDAQQELHYPAIARAIAETGFAGFFAHEFLPTRDALTSLREATAVCTV